MDVNKERAQVPEEKLEEVSGGYFFDALICWHYVCNKCGYVVDEGAIGRGEPGIRQDRNAQKLHDSIRGRTGSCTDGTMEYKGKITVER